jgi:hypothetical protein
VHLVQLVHGGSFRLSLSRLLSVAAGAKMEAHLGQHLLNLLQRLAPEIRHAQELGVGPSNEVADTSNIFVLETVGRAHRKFKIIDLRENAVSSGGCFKSPTVS